MQDTRTVIGHRYRSRRWITASAGALATSVSVAVAIGGATQPSTRANDAAVVSVAAPRVVVVKSSRLLHLFDGDSLVRTYPVDLGTAPVGPKRRDGDGRTPIGRFRVVTRNTQSPYHRFIGLDYPDLATTEWGLANGLISMGEAASIRRAHENGHCPNWGTALGGGIGIHGRRVGHDWTGGCIALSDEHVEELFAVLRTGDPVEVLP